MSTVVDTLPHERWCGPAAGHDEPRIERYRLPRYASDGTSQVGSVQCVRCVECGVTSYDGQQRD